MKAFVDAKAFYDAMKKVSGALHRSALPMLPVRMRDDWRWNAA